MKSGNSKIIYSYSAMRFGIENIDGTLIQTAEMTKMKWNGKKDQIILNKNALYFGLQWLTGVLHVQLKGSC